MEAGSRREDVGEGEESLKSTYDGWAQERSCGQSKQGDNH